MALNPPSGIVKWYSHNLVGSRSLATLKGQLTGVKQPGGSSATSYVKLSDKEADELIENIKKDPEGFPIFDEGNAPDKREEYQRWLVARYLTKTREGGFEGRKEEGLKELEEELGPEGLDELLGLIREEAKVAVAAGSGSGGDGSTSTGSPPPPPTSSSLAVVPKKPEDLVEEDIDSQILSILGLEDVFDLTYEEYASLLKEASVKARMPGSQMSTESVELITDEFKRVRNKTGRFKVKPKKVDINKVLDRKQPTPPGAIVKAEKLIPTAPEVSPEQEKKPAVDTENLQGDLIDGIGNILESLITIRTLLQSQGKTEQKSAQEDRKETEKKKKKEREKTLEKKKPKSPILKALTKPVGDFFSAIKKFFTNVLLGSVVLGLFKWLKDPKNQQAIDDFTNFLEKNAGLILGGLLAIAALPIAATLLNLSIGIISGIGVLTGALTKFGAFLVSPLGLGLLGALGLYGLAAKYRQIRDENIEQRMKDAERGTELIEQGGKSVMANTPSGVATLTGDRRPWWQKISQSYDQFIRTGELPNLGLAGIKNSLFGKKDITKSEDLGELREEYDRVNNELYNKIQAYKSGDIRFNKDIENLSIQKDLLSKRIKEVEKFIPKSTPSSKDPYAGADGLQRQLDDLTKPSAVQPTTPLMPGLPPSAAQPGTGPAGNQVGSSSSSTRSGPDPNATFRSPNKSKFSSFFGSKESFRKKSHEGIDDPIQSGTSLSFNQSGKIVDVYRTSSTSREAGGGYGQFVKVQLDDGKVLLMAHLSEISSWVKNGVKFNANEIIAKSGGVPGAPGSGRSGGAHLHFEQHNTPGLGLEETLRGKVDPIAGGGIAALQYGGIDKTGKVEMDSSKTTRGQVTSSAQIAKTPAPTPSIPSPTGRGNIVPLPIPTGGGQQQVSSGSAPNQAPVPRFSSEDPNNATTMVVRAIYNIVG